MITFSFRCITRQCTEQFSASFEVTLAPDTMLLVTMQQGRFAGWCFRSSDPARALCPQHNPDRVDASSRMRVFDSLHQISHVQDGLILVGVEKVNNNRHVVLGASRAPVPTGLVRLDTNAMRDLTTHLTAAGEQL